MIKDTLRLYPEIEKIMIFGSRAMGNEKKGSDIDLAVFGNISPSDLDKIHMKLSEELPIPYHIDIVDYNNLSNPELKRHIDEVGVVFYEKGGKE